MSEHSRRTLGGHMTEDQRAAQLERIEARGPLPKPEPSYRPTAEEEIAMYGEPEPPTPEPEEEGEWFWPADELAIAEADALYAEEPSRPGHDDEPPLEVYEPEDDGVRYAHTQSPALRVAGGADGPPFELPPGMTLWDGDDRERDERPRLAGGPAFDTWLGRLVQRLAPFTEADPAAMLLTLLTASGAAIGSGPHVYKGNVRHPGRLHVGIVGATSKSRKGTSWDTPAPILERADPEFFAGRIMGGFGSGEAVVDAVADPDESGEGGSRDKRLLVREPELTRLLKVANRQGSTLSEIAREAWDGGRLQVRSRTRTAVATGAHVSMVGHVTVEGLRRHLNDEDTVNGFANRWTFCAVGRAQVLPHGAEVPSEVIDEGGRELGQLIRAARKRSRVEWTSRARERWEDFYHWCAGDDTGGIVGAITARAEPQVARLALLFALLDPEATAIDLEHQAAAEAVWDHASATVRWVWGDQDGDPDADRLLAAIRAHGAGGMTGTEQSELFSRNKKAQDLERIRSRLERRGLIATGTAQSDGPGRPTLLSVATTTTETSSTTKPPIRSSMSFVSYNGETLR